MNNSNPTPTPPEPPVCGVDDRLFIRLRVLIGSGVAVLTVAAVLVFWRWVGPLYGVRR